LRILANEIVAGEIAALLGLPCAEVATVEVSSDFLDLNSSLRDQYTPRISPGNHFGVVEIRDRWRNPPRPLIAKVANKDDFPGVVLFDVWTLNTDRNNDGNYLIVKPQFAPNRFYFSTIDHGMCFAGPGWNESIATQVDARNFTIIPEVASEIRGTNPFLPCLSKAETIPDAQLRQILDAIPEDWQVTEAERGALLEFLVKRRAKLKEILQGIKGQFPFWTG
jgi:hypothetical protein